MPRAVTITEPVNELDSAEILATLTKEDGTALGPAALETLTLTLYDRSTDTIINAVEYVDILNVGRGTLDVDGNLIVTLESADMPIVTAGVSKEKHRALIVGTWNSGKGRTSQEVIFTVANVAHVPT